MLFSEVSQESQQELEAALKTAQKANWYRRLKVIELSAKGYQVPELATLFDLNAGTIRAYIHRYNRGGLAGLKAAYGPSRKAEISLSKEALEALLKRSPSQFEKLKTGARNWSQKLLGQYLWHYHQLKISQAAISGSLKRLGIVWRRAKKK